MENKKASLKGILNAIKEYYIGKQIKLICADNEIEEEVFCTWLQEYKDVASEIIELKLENELLRKRLQGKSIFFGASLKVVSSLCGLINYSLHI